MTDITGITGLQRRSRLATHRVWSGTPTEPGRSGTTAGGSAVSSGVHTGSGEDARYDRQLSAL